MKNLLTSSALLRFKKPLAGLFVLMTLSVQLVAQQPNCNAHFYHFSFNLNVNFYASINHSGTTYAWNFGDGDTSTQRNPVHTYAQPGTYYVCLTVARTNSSGSCSATSCDSIHVTLPPPPPPPVCNAHFTHHSISHSSSIDFDASHNPPGSTYLWDFGDGNTATVRDTNYTYALPGTYYACLTVTNTDSSGNVLCTDHSCDSVHVTLPPPPPPPVCNAHFTHHAGHVGSTDFDVVSHNPAGSVYTWDFGDGNTATVRDTDYTYVLPGTYYACLTVTRTDSSGTVLCTATWCDSVHVAPPPPLCNAHFSSNHHGHNLNIRFDSAHNPPGVTFAWDFGDGLTSTAHDPLHAYALPGAYYACLTVTNTDTGGVVICTATWCDSVFVDSIHVCHEWHHCDHRMSAGTETNSSGTATVYPNPIMENSVLHIENMTGNVTLRIFENTGRLVSSMENLSNGDFELNKKDLGSGLYFYQISDSNGNVLKGKLIVE